MNYHVLFLLLVLVSSQLVYGEVKSIVTVTDAELIQGGTILFPDDELNYDMKLRWNAESDLTITSIMAKPRIGMTFIFSDNPITVKDVKNGINEIVIDYKIKTEKRCENDYQIGNCLRDGDYKIPIEIRGNIGGTDVMFFEEFEYSVSNPYIFQYLILGMIIGLCVLIIYFRTRGKSNGGLSSIDKY